MTLPSHLFTSEDGALYDTRDAEWSQRRPLRALYSRHVQEITRGAEVRAALRAGGFAWPGGYPLFFVTSDGGALAFATVRRELRNVLQAIRDNDRNGGWRVIGVDVNYEDGDLTDDHTGERIPSAYAEDESEGE